MRNLKKLILVGGTSAVLAVTALTGCEMFRGGSDSGDRTAGRELDDKHITANVEKKLKAEPVYKFSDVDVKTFAGVVQLSGFVSSDEQKSRAGNLAQQVEGVARVVNNLTLKPNSPLEPTGRTNQVNPSIQSNP
jgi:hyperosmotically inducible periplasmic protein